MIGVNGSFMTGDFHEKSDLDLLILINDDRGWQLGCAFIQDDLQVGHDLYCTTWERLENDAKYEHPNISKLMDAKIVYCADEKYKEQLDKLRKVAENILSAPFSEEDYIKAEELLKEAEGCYTLAMVSDNKPDILNGAGGDTLIGTYEEMYSNWRNKMYAAAETGNRHLAFMSLVSSSAMFSEINSEVDIDRHESGGVQKDGDRSETLCRYRCICT